MRYQGIFGLILLIFIGCSKEAVQKEPISPEKTVVTEETTVAVEKQPVADVIPQIMYTPVKEEPDFMDTTEPYEFEYIFEGFQTPTPEPEILEPAVISEPEEESTKEKIAVKEDIVQPVTETPSPKDSVVYLYMVKPGDFLSKIAIKEYFQIKMWRSIWKWNYGIIGDNPNSIYPYHEFSLKKPSEMVNEIEYEFYEYTVLPNESLWSIAGKEYNNNLAWIVILRDNFDRIGSEHDRLPAGTVLKLRTRIQ